MLLDFLYKRFSKDLGIDLGTANTLVYVKGKGIVINEPSVVAVNTRTKQIVAIGHDAQVMVGRTPSHIVATKPLVDGVISDYEITESMLRYFIDKVHNQTQGFLRRPRVVIGVPAGVTEVEKRAVQDAAISAGARVAYLIEEPIAAAIGARLPVQDAQGSMIVDIGGGTTEIAVMSMGGLVVAKSLKVAGNFMDEQIVQYIRETYNLLIGMRTAEEVKIKIGSCIELPTMLTAPVRGRDLVTGLPKEITISDRDIREALSKPISNIIETIKGLVEEIPPEIISDVMRRGVVLAGGGASLRGLPELITTNTHIQTTTADEPLTCVVRGTGVVVEDLENLADVLLPVDRGSSPR